MDSGSGLSQEEQQQLFKRYSQTSAGRQQTGSGLGLMICKELIKNMQGDLSLESHPGIGTTFTITIPVEISQQVATVEAKAEQPITLPEKLSILIADDHPTNRLLLKRQLNLLGYDVDEATDGVQALHKVSMQHYDLLITDVNMPNMDGFELTRKLREQNSSLPIWGLQPTHRLTNVKRVKLRHELMFVQTVDPGCTENTFKSVTPSCAYCTSVSPP